MTQVGEPEVPPEVAFSFEYSACHISVPTYPLGQDPVKFPLRFGFNLTELATEFDSPEGCAIWLFPYLSINFAAVNAGTPKRTSSVFRMIEEVFEGTRRPSFVRHAAEKFMAKTGMGNEYVAFHWRYSRGDWFNHCSEERFNKKGKNDCRISLRFVSDICRILTGYLLDFGLVFV